MPETAGIRVPGICPEEPEGSAVSGELQGQWGQTYSYLILMCGSTVLTFLWQYVKIFSTWQWINAVAFTNGIWSTVDNVYIMQDILI